MASESRRRSGCRWPHLAPSRLGIRASLLLGVGGIFGLLLLTAAVAVLVTSRMADTIGRLLQEEVPATVRVLRLARAADALAAAGIPLAFVTSGAERQQAFAVMDEARGHLDAALRDVPEELRRAPGFPEALLADLRQNIARLQEMLDARLAARQAQEEVRGRLAESLQRLQLLLVPRVRVLDGDSDILRRLLVQPGTPAVSTLPLAQGVAELLPVARFYAAVEAIHAQVAAAGLVPALPALETARRFVLQDLDQAAELVARLPAGLRTEVEPAWSALRELAVGADGLLALRAHELRLAETAKALNEANLALVEQMDTAVGSLVAQSFAAIEAAGAATEQGRRGAMLTLALGVALALLAGAALFRGYIDRHVLRRLEGLSAAMLEVAAGRLDTPLPPEDGTELGRLAAAVRQFRDTAAGAKEREAALRQALHQAEAATRAKAAFLATMSHEIRTPMNAVLGMVQLALGTPLTESQRRYLTHIQTAARSLLGLIDDVLDLSKIEAGQLELEARPFAVAEVVARSVDLVRLRAEEKGLRLTVVVAPDVPSHVVGDPLRLGQVLTNLLSNAVKFTERGEVAVRVDLEGQGAEGRVRLRLAVQDTGIGMDAATVGRLFQRFTQADASMARRYGGSGLGLAIAKELVERMGGAITVASQPGQGSTFTVVVPLAVAEALPAPAPQPAPAVVADGMAFAGRRVLVVEDNAVNSEVARELLERLGAEVTVAEGGTQALERLAQESFDLVFMDVQMPGMDGFETTRRIRAQEGGSGRHIPIVAMTAQAMAGDREDCLAAGMDDYLAKPIDLDGLARTLARWLGRPAAPTPPAGGVGDAASGGAAWGVAAALSDAPFDVPRALARCGGAEAVLRRMFGHFVTQYAGAAARLRALAAQGQREEVARLAHGLKGAAATLEASALAEAAAALEAAARTGQAGHLPELAEAVALALAPTLAAARQWAEGGVPAVAAAPPADAGTLLAELEELVARHSLRTREALVALAPLAPHQAAVQEALAEATACADRLDFAGAAQAVARLRETWPLGGMAAGGLPD